MFSRKSSAGSAAPAVLFAIVLLLLVGSTLFLHIDHIWWFPPPITPVGQEIDQQMFLTFILTGIVFVLAQVALAWVVFRYRDRKGHKAQFIRGSHALEVIWTTITLVIFVGLGVMAAHAWGEVHFGGPAPGALQVEVTGVQFVWNFRYPGPDGKFGRIIPKDIDASVGNPIGIDPNDPEGKENIVSPDLYLPVDRPIVLWLRSQDVIHSFFVRELRVKQDAVPGLTIPIHFTVTKIGDYEITCNQLCGLGHYRMHAMLHVLSQADFEQWEKKQWAGLEGGQ